jgi:subtilase family serine protease
MLIKLQLEKKKEKNKEPMMIKVKVSIGFLFDNQDTIDGVIGFRIDSHTMKRG